MSDIASALKKIQIEGARAYSATSESLIQYMGASVNKIIDMLSSPVSHNVWVDGSVVHVQTGYGIYSDSTTYTVPASNYALVTVIPRNAGETAAASSVTSGSYPTSVTYVPPQPSGAGKVTRFWLQPGETVTLTSGSGQGGDHYIKLFPISAIHDYPTS